MIKKIALFLLLVSVLIAVPDGVYAKSLFHATEKAVARRIARRGFSLRRMRPTARFGKGVYLSESRALAMREKPAAKAVVAFKDSKLFRKRVIDSSRLKRAQLKRFSGDFNFRDNIRKGIIGPDLDRKIGRTAGRTNHVISYRSAKGKGTNYFIPQKLYKNHSGIVKPVRVIPVK